MVCLKCTMLSIFFWLQIIFCSCTNETKLFSFLRLLLHENGRFLCFPKIFFGKLCKLADQYYLTQHSALANIDLLTTDKSQYFCSTSFNNCYYFLLRLGGPQRQETSKLSNSQPAAVQAYFGWAKPCSCSKYCGSRHL